MSEVRTIKGAYQTIKDRDPQTALTLTALRRLCATGELPTSKIGSKYLVNLDVLEAYLRGELIIPSVKKDSHGVRRISA